MEEKSDLEEGLLLRRTSQRRSQAAYETRFDLVDHFSLRSNVFRHGDKVVLSGVRHQHIFELERNDEEEEEGGGSTKKRRRVLVSVKRASVYGGGIFMLKFLYSYVAMFFLGVGAVFSLLVFLQYGLGVFLVGMRGANSVEEKSFTMLSLLALPAFVNALSMIITLSVGFLNDIWNDFEFLNTVSAVNPVIRDWMHVSAAALIPLGTFGTSLVLGRPSPFSDMLLAALICMLTLFVFCILYSLGLEVYSSVRIVKAVIPKAQSTRRALRELFLLRIRHMFALTDSPKEGQAWINGIAVGEDPEAAFVTRIELENKLSSLQQLFYENVPVQRVFSLENVLRPRPYMSRRDGSILFFCCLRSSRFLGTIPKFAVWSSFACIIVSALLVWFVFVGFLMYSTFIPDTMVVILSTASFVVICLFLVWSFRDVMDFKESNKQVRRHLRSMNRRHGVFNSHHHIDEIDLDVVSDQNGAENGETGDEDGDGQSVGSVHTPAQWDLSIYNEAQAINSRKYIFAKPKLPGVLILFTVRVLVTVVVPAYSLFYLGISGYATFFLACSLVNHVRELFNVEVLIQIFGSQALETLELPFLDEFIEENDGMESSPTHATAMDATRTGNCPTSAATGRQASSGSVARSMEGLGTLWSPERQVDSARTSSGGRRIYLLLTRMTKVTIRNVFIYIFAFCTLCFMVLAAFSIDLDTTHSDYDGPELIGNATHRTHFVPRQSKMEIGFQYPVCDILDEYVKPDVPLPFIEQKPLLGVQDLAFLSDLAYSSQNSTQKALDAWFSPDVADYLPTTGQRSGVIFKVFKFKLAERFIMDDTDLYVVSIRGTTNTMDLLSDMQIWFPALLFQVLRFTLPFGEVWDSIIPSLIKFMNVLESNQHKNNPLTFEADVSDFVKGLLQKKPAPHVLLTGHSLGGGLATIVGAELKVPAVGFSAPNAMLSRLKFGVTKDALDKYTVNVIPRGDPVPLVDEQALLKESILCRTEQGEPLGVCHQMSRTLCELQFICGSGARPPLEICSESYRYPKPKPLKDYQLLWDKLTGKHP